MQRSHYKKLPSLRQLTGVLTWNAHCCLHHLFHGDFTGCIRRSKTRKKHSTNQDRPGHTMGISTFSMGISTILSTGTRMIRTFSTGTATTWTPTPGPGTCQNSACSCYVCIATHHLTSHRHPCYGMEHLLYRHLHNHRLFNNVWLWHLHCGVNQLLQWHLNNPVHR